MRRTSTVSITASLLGIATSTLLGIAPATASPDVTTNSASTSDPPPSDTIPAPAWPEISELTAAENQDALNQLTSELLSDEGIYAQGYVATVDDVPNRTATLLWHGEGYPNPAVMTRAAELGVRVTLKPWPYSKAQLEAASAQLQQEYGWKLNLGFAVRSYLWITPEFAGVEVEGGMPSGKPLSAQQVAGVEAEMAKRVNMPVKLVQTGPPAPLSRTNDFSPYNAGGFMADLSTQTACSSGFSIKLSNGLNYTITARHCDAPAYATFDSYNTGSPLYYGTTTGTQPSAGAARILSGRGSLLTFSGPYNSGGTRQVRDIVNLSVGDAVYTSGGNSGSHGGNIVTGVGTTSDIYGSFPATRAAQTNNSVISAAKGDSGGPVFTLHADGTVAGEGMIQNGAGYVVSNCGAMNVPNVLCYSALYFTTMPTILNSISGGASLVTITNP